MATGKADLKQEAHRLIDLLPAKATWDDLLNAIYGRMAMEEGIADLEQGCRMSDEELRKCIGLR